MSTRESTAPAGDGRRRVVIERVRPEIDSGRFPIKRCVGDSVVVEADVFTDGHDAVAGRVLHRRRGGRRWREAPLEPLENDRWRAAFAVAEIGRHEYTVEAWIDRFRSWRRDLSKRVDADQDVSVDLLAGAELVRAAAARAHEWENAGGRTSGRERARREDAGRLADHADTLGDDTLDAAERVPLALSDELDELVRRYQDRAFANTYPRTLEVVVDREKAGFSAWYEMFPRSASPEPGRHGTFRDVEARLPYIAEMGFDVLYLPPIHPIGATNRKGRNNSPRARKGDVGSPWAIGAEAGGHEAVHPELGTLDDFRRLVAAAEEHGIEVALDIAYQASPDHPYVERHPEWFRRRADGSIQYAENPPKKYEDIFPFDFDGESWRELWEELKSVVDFWIEQGVRIFRVDNPHTKPFAFWEWLIGEVKAGHPDVIFLSEAFTRPKVMYRLAKLGFTQSYTYFAWRNTKWELTEYLRELTQTEVREYFRPSFWPNTPDILTEYLQTGGRPAFVVRLVLAATLVGNYGIYGPAFELMEARPREPGGEEYLDSEKYQLRHWEIGRADSLREFIARVNRIRRENPAFRNDRSLRFHPVGAEALIAYTRHAEAPARPANGRNDGRGDASRGGVAAAGDAGPTVSGDVADPTARGAAGREAHARAAERGDGNLILVVANLDPFHTQSGWLDLPLEELGIDPDRPYQLHELITGARYLWTGSRNYVELDPRVVPVHIFRVSRHLRTERDFEYYM